MDTPSSPAAAPAPPLRDRRDIADRYKWALTDIYPDWTAWQAAHDELTTKIGAYGALQGTLAGGADRLLVSLQLADAVGQLMYRVWYFVSLWYDQDQRDKQQAHTATFQPIEKSRVLLRRRCPTWCR